MEIWKGNLILSNGQSIADIHISSPSATSTILQHTAQLRVLAFIDPSRIPLHLIFGSKLDVWTADEATEGWFSNILINDDNEDDAWWHSAQPESPLAVLASVESTEANANGQPNITEILFLASKSSTNPPLPPTPPRSSQSNDVLPTLEPTISLHALTLSSDLLHNPNTDATPPPSPSAEEVSNASFQATFLPTPTTNPASSSSPLKRKQLSSTFDSADALRKRIRSAPGSSVQASAITGSARSMPSLKALTASSLQSQSLARSSQFISSSSRPPSSGTAVPMQTRPLSRSSSIASASNGRRGSTVEGMKHQQQQQRSNLARVENSNAAGFPDPTTTTSFSTSFSFSSSTAQGEKNPAIEKKNRDVISRLVMAGMRLHGLSQSKGSRKDRKTSLVSNEHGVSATTTAESTTTAENAQHQHEDEDEQEQERIRNDEEFKLIYHNTFKATLFAFRNHISSLDFSAPSSSAASSFPSSSSSVGFIETLRAVVDKFLATFCCDPLVNGLLSASSATATVTPAERKAFDTPGDEGEGESPFLGARRGGDGRRKDGVEITPNFRKKGKEREREEKDEASVR